MTAAAVQVVMRSIGASKEEVASAADGARPETPVVELDINVAEPPQ